MQRRYCAAQPPWEVLVVILLVHAENAYCSPQALILQVLLLLAQCRIMQPQQHVQLLMKDVVRTEIVELLQPTAQPDSSLVDSHRIILLFLRQIIPQFKLYLCTSIVNIIFLIRLWI